MKKYTSVKDLGDLKEALQLAQHLRANPYQWDTLGKNKTIILLFFNSSLRTRLSTQKAAMNLGMNTMVLDINQGAWKLESERGVIMDGDKPEHLLEAIPVIGSYCDLIGVRAFAALEDRNKDYQEIVLNSFIHHSGVPVVSLESATAHPLQGFADIITIEDYKKTPRPKVVLTWAPHPRALPQAVPNSFAEFALAFNYDLVITHPHDYELSQDFTAGATIEYDQDKALAGADFVYAKNWSSYNKYGQILCTDRSWTLSTEKMALTNEAYFMHCLPVRRNMIVSDEVIESKQSLVVPQAKNRVVSAQTVLSMILNTLK